MKLIPSLVLALALMHASPGQAERSVAFTLDVADQIPALRLIRRGVSFNYTMSADELTPGERVMHVGSGTLQFADEQILIPVCLAKLIQSARADDVTASIINSHNGIKLTGSALRLTFHPGSDIPNASRKDIRLDFLLDPLMLIAVTTRPHQPGSGLFEKVPLIEFCDPSEILLMTPSNK